MKKRIISFTIVLLTVVSCSVSYKFNGASIDYTKIKTITIKDFTNLAPLVNPSLAPSFNESLRDVFAKQTRLRQVQSNGDMQLEGEFIAYDVVPMAIQSDAISAETKLSVTVKVRYTNKVTPSKNFEKTFTAFQTFSNTRTLAQVQDELCRLIIDELTDIIYNQTASDW